VNSARRQTQREIEGSFAPSAGEAPEKLAIDFLERYRFLLLCGFSVFFLVGTALRARSSPFWHDELYTILLARLDLGSMRTAIQDGVEPSPPFADILVRIVNSLWGEGNIVSRIPAIAGFWIFCLCLFTFVRRRLDISYAFAAMILPLSTGAYDYATQARCYGIILGLCGLALVSWQTATEGRRRAGALFLLAFCLAAALYSHYYAILLVAPLAGGQLWRDWRRKKVDWPVWAALSGGEAAGLILCYPLLSGARRFVAHGWAKPTLYGLLLYYPEELQKMLVVAIAFLILGAVWWLLRRKDASWTGIRDCAVPDHEITAAGLFLLLPAAGFVIAVFVTNMFHPRYFISAIAGVVLTGVLLAAIWSRCSRPIGILLLLAATPGLSLVIHHRPVTPVIDDDPLLRGAIEQGPIIMDDGQPFLKQWYYLPASMKSRVEYVADPQSEVRWTETDVTDLGMLSLKKWFGLPILDYEKDVATPGKTVRIYHNSSGSTWLLNRLLADGAKIEVQQTAGDRAVLMATITGE